MGRAEKMLETIYLDFETFYSQTYSLSKMTTEEYIRGDEYETIGVAVKAKYDAPAEWSAEPTTR